MSDPERPRGDPTVRSLEAEIVRLNKIIQALMDRSESRTGVEGSGFGLFQTTIMLQDHVRLRSEELQAASREERSASGSRTTAADLQTLRRTAALQIQLLELVVQQKDVGELIDRVAALLDMPIVLFDARGRALHSSQGAAASPELARRLWTRYASLRHSPDPPGTVEDAGDQLYFRDVLVMDRVERVLAARASRRRPTEFADASLVFLQQLVALDLLRNRDELTMRQGARRRLLRDVLAGDGSADDLRRRLEEQGLDEKGVWRIAVVEPASPPVSPARAHGPRAAEQAGVKLLRALDTVLGKRRSPYLTLALGSMAVVLCVLPDGQTATAGALLSDLHEAAERALSPGEAVAGCSAAVAGVQGIPHGLRQAQTACMAARREASQSAAVVFDDLSGQFRLLDGLDDEALAEIVNATFAPLLEYDARHRASLYETLSTLFDHRLAVQETAAVLHIHRNTLQKRLAHVQRLLAIDLSEIDDLVDIRLGLHAAHLLERSVPAAK